MWDLGTLKRLNGKLVTPRRARISSRVKRVLDDNQSLSLDSDKDRAVLLNRLLEVL
jgi:hypothetical protein